MSNREGQCGMGELQRQREACLQRRHRMAMAVEAYLERQQSEPSQECLARRRLAVRRINQYSEAWQWWQTAKADVSDFMRRREKPSVREIMAAVADATGISIESQCSHCRLVPLVIPRQIAMYLASEMTEKSDIEVGRCFGGRDHTTVMFAKRKIAGLIGKDSRVDDIIASVRRTIESRRQS